MFREILVLSVLAVLILGYANSQTYSQSYTTSMQQDQGRAPIVVNAYAAKVIRPGDTWMIFIQAEDPNGDMKSIAAVLWEAGVGYYPTEVNMLKAEDAKQFSGYLFMKTPTGFNLNWDEFELTLIVRDSRMHGSQPVKLAVTFDQAAKQVIPEKWKEAANHEIASLMFDIESSSFYNRGGNGGNFN